MQKSQFLVPRGIPQLPMGAPPPSAYAAKDFFTYGIVLENGITSGSNGNGSFNVDNDSDFMWLKGTYFAAVADAQQQSATREVPGVTVTIKDTTSGRDIMNVPVAIPAMFGTGELPFILPVGKLLPKTATITVAFQNITDGDYSYLALYFHGQKLYG